MGTWPVILAENGSGSELIYIIAVLILGAVGAIFEKIKHKMAEPKDDERQRPPVPGRTVDRGQPRPPVVPPGPARPARPPVRPSRPPVAAPPARPVGPAPSVPRPAAPARHPAPRRPAPAPRRPQEVQRPVLAEPAPLVSRPAPGEHEVTHLPERHVPTHVKEAETDRRAPGVLTPAAGIRPAAGAGPVPTDLVSDVGSFRNLTLAEVRRAIVLNEILSSPLALRDAGGLDQR